MEVQTMNTTKSIASSVRKSQFTFVCLLGLFLVSCNDGNVNSTTNSSNAIALEASKGQSPALTNSTYSQFSPVAYDLDVAPDGSILVTQNGTVKKIRKGAVTQVAEIPGTLQQPANGIATTGRGSYFLASGGLDLAAGAGVWHVNNGGARLIGDIEHFETTNDPDAFEGPQWKNQACEEDPAQGFTAGPQSNPYHLAALTGSTVLVGDAAGNTVLSVKKNGTVDWVALLTPPTDSEGDYRVLKTAENDASIDCYVQPVPTSVAIGPDGDYFVGELTGAPAIPGWSRIWRIQSGAKNVVCPSSQCTMFADGLTSVIDLTFGPDGMLYALEYDVEGWAVASEKAFDPDEDLVGGTLNRFDIDDGSHTTLSTGLPLPSAISFDKWGDLWILENNLVAPTVRKVSLP